MKYWGGRRKRGVCLASSSQNSSNDVARKRKVVEHLCLLRAKENLSDEQEKYMLDNLYTSQYHMAGIVTISLGLAKFYENPLYLRILKEHVTPFCHDLLYVDFEAEVEDDILAIFRKGEVGI
uniref:Uncharacterized protein n=1 Tax=Chenopodium quinoa TaxID=63459 RepID=A0A803NAE5_CHEQI